MSKISRTSRCQLSEGWRPERSCQNLSSRENCFESCSSGQPPWSWRHLSQRKWSVCCGPWWLSGDQASRLFDRMVLIECKGVRQQRISCGRCWRGLGKRKSLSVGETKLLKAQEDKDSGFQPEQVSRWCRERGSGEGRDPRGGVVSVGWNGVETQQHSRTA